MKRIPWNNDWYFTPHYEPALTALNAPQENLEAVRLPHTVAMLPFNEFSEQAYQMVSGYLRFFTPPESWRGKRVRPLRARPTLPKSTSTGRCWRSTAAATPPSPWT